MNKGEIWLVDLGIPVGSEPGYLRPVVIIQTNELNKVPIRTTIVAVITSNLNLASAIGNVSLPTKKSGLKRDSVINISQIRTINKSALKKRVGKLSSEQMFALNQGLRLVFALEK